LIGANTFGKSVGQVAIDRSASNDISKPLGDPNETSIRQALDFLAGRRCQPIVANTAGKFQARAASAAPKTVAAHSTGWLEPAFPDQRHPAQRETPRLH